MDFIKRKVFLTKNLKPYDSNGDGVFNALVLSATTKHIQIPIRHSFDDIGIYEVDEEESFEIIDIGSFFDGSFTGVTQPTDDPSVTGNTWNGGGDAGNGGSNDTEIRYCGDVTAQQYSVLTYNGGTAVLTPNNGPATTYPAPIPIFTIDNSLCVYDDNPGDLSGTGDTGSDNVSDMFCLRSSEGHGDPGHVSTTTNPRTGYCNNSWFNVSPWNVTSVWTGSYENVAYSKAVAYCQSQGYTTTLQSSDFTGSIPQGNPINNASQPWAKVKYQSVVQGSCCANPPDCTITPTGTYWRYCFFCKK
jgi:hypothetical protein